MLEHLEALDRSAFLAINGWHSVWTDDLMLLISGKSSWIPLYVFLLFLLQRRLGWRGLAWAVPVIGLMILCSDQGSVQLFKESVRRLRPCHEPTLSGMVHLVPEGCGGQYGFVSSHAANHSAIAFFMIGILGGRPRWSIPALVLWAALVGYSRIYLGVHYPGDVLVGSLFGATVGIIFVVMLRRILQYGSSSADT